MLLFINFRVCLCRPTVVSSRAAVRSKRPYIFTPPEQEVVISRSTDMFFNGRHFKPKQSATTFVLFYSLGRVTLCCCNCFTRVSKESQKLHRTILHFQPTSDIYMLAVCRYMNSTRCLTPPKKRSGSSSSFTNIGWILGWIPLYLQQRH